MMDTDHLAGLIRSLARRHPTAVAIRYRDRVLSYVELDRASDAVAARLRVAGVDATSRVAYLDRNRPDFFVLLFAVAKLRAVLVPLNWRLSRAELAALVADARPAVVVLGADYEPVAPALRDAWPAAVVLAATDLPARTVADADAAADWAPADVAVQMYSSGTTGLPKGVLLSHRNLLAKFRVNPGIWGLRPGSVSLVAMPLFHIGAAGWALGALYHGATALIVDGAEPAELLATIRRERVTHAFLVPTVLGRILESSTVDIECPALRTVVYGASPIDPAVLRRAIEAFGCEFVHAYGLTEATGQVVSLPAREHARYLDRAGPEANLPVPAGRPDPGVEVRIRDLDDGTALPAGQPGEVLVRGAQVMLGYWQRPQDTAAVLRPDGWLRTGDVGMLDEFGCLVLLDRVKDLIVSGGENISPAEIESVLREHPGVADVAVIGVASARWGETPLALVVPAGAVPVPENALLAHCRERLAGFKCPTAVRFVDDLPRNATGKVLKKHLRETWRAVDPDPGAQP